MGMLHGIRSVSRTFIVTDGLSHDCCKQHSNRRVLRPGYLCGHSTLSAALHASQETGKDAELLKEPRSQMQGYCDARQEVQVFIDGEERRQTSSRTCHTNPNPRPTTKLPPRPQRLQRLGT